MASHTDEEYDGLSPIEGQGDDQMIDPFATTIDDILREVGAENVNEFLFDVEKVEPRYIRGQVFNTLEEVIFFLFDIGVISFGGAIRDADGKFHPFIGDTPEGRKKRKKDGRTNRKRKRKN